MSVNSSTSSSETFARHLRRLLAGIALLALAVAGLNLAVDPYRVFGTPDLAGFNALKPDFVESLRMTVPHAIDRHRPDALILGTSRAGRGYSPQHPAFAGLDAYNAALPAVSLYEMMRVLQHAQATRPLKRVVLGLDNRVFYADRDGNGAFSEARLRVDAQGRPQRRLFTATLPDYAASLLSTDALLASLRAVRFQGWTRLTLDDDGRWRAVGDAFDSRAGFRAMTLNTFDRYRRYSAEPFRIEQAIAPLREILRLCHRAGIDLRMIVPPSHAWHVEAMRHAGMIERFDEIRRAIVATNEGVARELGRPPFPLWDYSGYRGHNVEAAPLTKDARPAWFWETVHFKPALGAAVFDEVFAPADAPPPVLGEKIDGANIEAHLAAWHAARETWAAAHPDEVAAVDELYRQWRTRAP
ncbi:MAG: hypothetical protein AB7I32_03630 [Gammaproteobacteria bacterium]